MPRKARITLAAASYIYRILSTENTSSEGRRLDDKYQKLVHKSCNNKSNDREVERASRRG